MTKKDFVLIARTLSHMFAQGAWCMDDADDRLRTARLFADNLADTNPLFDRARFIKACFEHETIRGIVKDSE